jgi:hypothetical protein
MPRASSCFTNSAIWPVFKASERVNMHGPRQPGDLYSN